MHTLPALSRLPPRVLRFGPWGMIAAGLIVGALAARTYLRRTSSLERRKGEESALARWDGEGGAL